MTATFRVVYGAGMSCLVQKDSRALKPNRTMVKVSCFVCEYWHRTSPHWIRKVGVGNCQACGAQMYPARIDDCLELAPALVDSHPDYEAFCAANARATGKVAGEDWGHGEGFCAACEWRRPDNADPDYWYCRKCGSVNDRQPDGTMGVFRANPFSVEVETANGRSSAIPF